MSGLEVLAAHALVRDAAQPAIEFERQWVRWGEIRQVADRLSALIDTSGAGAYAPVAFVPRNRPSAVAALLGLIAKGRTVRMIYAFQSATALARDVERLKPAILVAAAEDYSEELISVLREQGTAAIALKEMDAAALPGFERSQRPAEAQGSSPSQVEILTSGTTGPPKRFAVGYDLIARHMMSGNTSAQGSESEQLQLPPTLLFFPVGNISGIYSTLPPLLKGQRAVLLERFSVAGWHDYIVRFRPAATGLPPAGVQMVLDASIPPADLACIRRLGTGAAPLDPTVHRAFEERYGIPILLSYGATEFGGPVAAMTEQLHAVWGQKKFGTVGRALPGAQLRVIDPDTGAVLPPGTEGILEVISPRIGPDWIRTSDLAMIDEDGFLFHRGRADGAIMRGGFKVLPETIERALMLHPAVSAAAVTGLADKRLGQIPAAAIQLKPGVEPPTSAQLEEHLRSHVLATHIPVVWRFVEDLPRTPSLKVDRPALKRLFEAN
jgi:acyl-coenzyme A synthetase/AMP-(fatty) acid ligase